MSARDTTIIILKHFKRHKAAEHESVIRITSALVELGWVVRELEVDSEFRFTQLRNLEDGASLVLDIHYEYPKFTKAKTIGAFWTPTFFMKDWDFPYVMENQVSHDFLAHPDSFEIEKVLKIFRPNEHFNIVNHSLPASWIDWIDDQRRNSTPSAFYCGINWKKLDGSKGRHEELFSYLDKFQVLDIFGPKKLQHVKPWKGFDSYRGEIPFDGKSILRATRASGISLVISSEPHIKEGIATNRFFESLAAGNAVLCDEHPFVKKNLGKMALQLNSDKGSRYVGDQIIEYVNMLRAEPKELQIRQEYSRELFLERFDLTKQLKQTLSTVRERPKGYASADLAIFVLGSSKLGLFDELKNIGFERIVFTKQIFRSMEELLYAAKLEGLSDFCVLTGSTEILDGFKEAVSKLLEELKISGCRYGVIPTTALSQTRRRFSPVILNFNGDIPLNGLVVNSTGQELNLLQKAKLIPYLRVDHISQVSYLNSFPGPFEFITEIFEDATNNNKGHVGVRKSLSRELDRNYVESRDIIGELRSKPREIRKLLAYSLLAAIPILRPFVWITRKILQK